MVLSEQTWELVLLLVKAEQWDYLEPMHECCTVGSDNLKGADLREGGVVCVRGLFPGGLFPLQQIDYLSFCGWSVAQSFLTLCDPMDCSMPGFPVLHHLPELAQTHVH